MNELFEDHVFSVDDLTTLIKQTLEGSFYGLTVAGEISNFRPASSGHWYFQLNDTEASIQAVMFKQKSWRLPFLPKDGDRVVVTGNISVYAKRGSYQIICETMTRSGTGDILALLEKRKQEFAAAGYFDPERKRPLPAHPKRVGVVTSPTGAAVRDILQVLQRRNPSIDIVVLPAVVQGDGAAKTISAQIEAANRWRLADILIIGRGGGSLEDLLPFSEKIVIEAIVSSEIPIVSAVGHEIDWALSDFAADLRAPTPSAAAELVSQPLEDITRTIRQSVVSMAEILQSRITLAKSRTALFTPDRMTEYFSRRMEQAHLKTDDLRQSMSSLVVDRLKSTRSAWMLLDRQLETLSPLAILDRGYSIVTTAGGKRIVRDANTLSPGDALAVRFAKGSITATTDTVGQEH
jgi:exodeoxyribonuclease VII large subunit